MIALLVLLAAPITLEEVRAASRQNLDALRAEIEARRQQLGVDVAKSAIWPQLTVSGAGQGFYSGPQVVLMNTPVRDSANPNQVVGFTQSVADLPFSTTRANYNLSVVVQQLIVDGGRWWNQIALSGHQAEAAQGQLEEQQLVSEFEAVSRFYQLLNAQLSLSVLENAVKRSETQLDRADSLYEAARATKLDALTAAVNLGNDRIAVLRQRQAVITAQVELLKWLGQPTREIVAADASMLQPDLPQRPAPQTEAALQVAKRHRPLLRVFEEQVAAAQKQIDVAWAPFFPSLNAQAGYQRQAPSGEPFFTDPSRNNTVWAGLNLSWQVFNGFGHHAQVKQARESLSLVQLQRERVEVDLSGDVRRAIEQLETQLQVARIASDNLKLTEASLNLAEERFTAGAGSTLEVRDAQVKLINAQLARLQARVDVEVARAGLKRVVGADVEEVR